MYIELNYEPEADVHQPEPSVTSEERTEAAEKIDKVRQKAEI